ncbi:MAG: spermidine/putrescine ABC transporter substrate-binding protein [bacterium]|nr:spermidine/putrescine ABC transporter substrate-binding protein [bacterium]
MNKGVVTAFVLIAILIGAGLFYKRPAQTLQLYTWDTYEAPQLFADFEKRTGIKVVATLFYSNDDLEAKLKAGAQYDVITPSGNYISRLVNARLLQPLPEQLKVHASSLSRNVQHPAYDPEYKWSLPLFYGTTGIAVNTGLTNEKITSWEQILHRPAGEKEGIGMLGEESSTLMAIASIAGGAQNCDPAPATHARLEALLNAQKPFVKTYKAEGYFEHLAANDVTFQMAWSGDAYIARQKNPKIQYVYPREGVELWLDTLAVPATSRNLKAVIAFIDFIMEPTVLAKYTVVSGNIPSVDAARSFLPQEFRDAPEFNIPLTTKTFVSEACSPAVVEVYNRIAGSVATK